MNKKEIKIKIAEMMKLNWQIKIIAIPKNEGGGYCACIPLLGEKFCRADGETVFESVKALETTLHLILYDYLKEGADIPTP